MAEKKTFEIAMRRLDEILESFSDGQLPLQQSLDLYKEASELVAYCNGELENAELVVEEYRKKLFPEDSE